MAAGRWAWVSSSRGSQPLALKPTLLDPEGQAEPCRAEVHTLNPKFTAGQTLRAQPAPDSEAPGTVGRGSGEGGDRDNSPSQDWFARAGICFIQACCWQGEGWLLGGQGPNTAVGNSWPALGVTSRAAAGLVQLMLQDLAFLFLSPAWSTVSISGRAGTTGASALCSRSWSSRAAPASAPALPPP